MVVGKALVHEPARPAGSVGVLVEVVAHIQRTGHGHPLAIKAAVTQSQLGKEHSLAAAQAALR